MAPIPGGGSIRFGIAELRAIGELLAFSVARWPRDDAFAALSARFDRYQILPRPFPAVTALWRKLAPISLWGI